MAIWIAKAIVQKVISFLPNKHSVNYFFQKNITKGLVLTDVLFETKLGHCKQHIEAYSSENPNKQNFSSLELGTGWFPVVPIGLFLRNAGRMYSVDIESLLTIENTKTTIKKFIDYHDTGLLEKLFPGYNPERMDQLRKLYHEENTLGQINEALHFEIIVGDILDKTILKNVQVDLIHSNNTFEHIPSVILEQILFRFKELLSPNGIMSHFIDLSDHFSHFDKKITSYNFLSFSDSTWKLIDNSIQPQNRLRISDYKSLYKKVELPIRNEILISGDPSDLRKIKLAEKYRNINQKDLLVTHALLVS